MQGLGLAGHDRLFSKHLVATCDQPKRHAIDASFVDLVGPWPTRQRATTFTSKRHATVKTVICVVDPDGARLEPPRQRVDDVNVLRPNACRNWSMK